MAPSSTRRAVWAIVVLATLSTPVHTMADTAETDATAQKIKELEDEKKLLQLNNDLAVLRKNTAVAEKETAEAKLAQTTAKLGGVPDSGIKGDVTIDPKGGELEMALLATAAINRATADIGTELASLTKAATLYIYPAGAPPRLQAVAAFMAQKALVERALEQAAREADDLIDPKAATESVAAVGLAIESITKLLGFFRSDFKVGGADISFDDSVLVQAVARDVQAKKVLVPTLYNAVAVTGAQTLVSDELTALASQQQKAAEVGAKLDQAIEAREKEATTPEQKASLEKSLQPLRVGSQRIKAASAAYDTLLARLLGSDEAAVALLGDLATWKGLRRPDTQLLLVKAQRTGGSYYVTKNLWTSFGAMPFSVAGGAVLSYTLLQAADGSVLMSGVRPIHGGFQKVKDVPAVVGAAFQARAPSSPPAATGGSAAAAATPLVATGAKP